MENFKFNLQTGHVLIKFLKLSKGHFVENLTPKLGRNYAEFVNR